MKTRNTKKTPDELTDKIQLENVSVANPGRAAVRRELMAIAAEHGGILQATDIVESARREGSILHSFFEWDDSTAAENFRLYQARQLVRVTVTIEERTNIEMRVFVSLKDDRKEGGYRLMTDVLTDSDLRERMLNDAITELRALRRKYGNLEELAKVFSAVAELDVPRSVSVSAEQRFST